jgi:hypothetical protein
MYGFFSGHLDGSFVVLTMIAADGTEDPEDPTLGLKTLITKNPRAVEVARWRRRIEGE